MSKQEGQRHPLEPRQVGKGIDAPRHRPDDPQQWLAGSNHPYAPFPGNALKWESWVYDDGTTFEGLTREGVPHGKGVMVFGNGTGAGFQRANRGERYEGEFAYGFAHGMGMHTTAKGEIYRGEYLLGKRHGCGQTVDLGPYYRRVAKGQDLNKAWEDSLAEISAKTVHGSWKKDILAGKSGSSRQCPLPEVLGTVQEVDEILTKARMFQHKPDGDVIFMTFQDAQSIPISTFQDPLHYPHNTKFLAPGPLGQCHPIPDDPQLKAEMLKHARNHHRIHSRYNLPYQSAPGSDMAKAIEAFKEKVAALRKKARRVRELERRRLRRMEQRTGARSSAPARDEQDERRGPGRAPPTAIADEEDDDGELDDEDLLASTAGVEEAAAAASPSERSNGSRSGGFPPPTAFGSISLGMSRAANGLCCMMERVAIRAQRRRCLSRPTYR
ncbi:g1095 [Coccomyxa viridis]|uniref:G1095 protein n=1 Tax=Coccomyxa viridis TaxID=1274662 RepID=A0ABP1FH83_9CHLO